MKIPITREWPRTYLRHRPPAYTVTQQFARATSRAVGGGWMDGMDGIRMVWMDGMDGMDGWIASHPRVPASRSKGGLGHELDSR